MSKTAAVNDIATVRRDTDRAQASAADPVSSAWVSANAGTGKTHVLTNRVLRLLLAETQPARILCLTYTKAAAAEMSTRVFDRLGKWVTLSDDELSKVLSELTGSPPDAADLNRARTLFTSAIETPGGLKVQTIHAFAERLLQRFPLEANVPPGFRILDDARRRELLGRAIEATLQDATAAPESQLGDALQTIIRYASDASFDDLLSRTIEEHAWLLAMSRIEEGKHNDDVAGAEKLLRRALGVGTRSDRAAIEAARAAVLTEPDLRALRDLLSTGGKTDAKHAAILSDALAQTSPVRRAAALHAYFLTGRDEPRDKLLSKALGEERQDLAATAAQAQDKFHVLTNELLALSAVTATCALYRLAAAVLQRYSDAKAAAGALDFDDLIARTMSLLATSRSADWVLFKLDGGLDHILVDEAQDTSPEQWQIIEMLAREFFSGSGAREEVLRTVFAVGDEKQSIYSFQGAAPEKFDAMGRLFAALANDARVKWRNVPLNLSFRSVQAVLDSVDKVFENLERTPGLTASAQSIRHIASRFGHGGRVELWPTEATEETDAADPWSPLADASSRAPVNRLAENIAATIDRWLTTGEVLTSSGKPIQAGDILILVRKRNPFAVPMVAALKARGIPVAGSDRVQLTDQVAVKDLLALGDFLTLPEDDLSLATVLKSPLFNLDDGDLLAIAPGRKGTLWKALLAHADDDARFKPAAEALRRWRAKADFTPPFEFFSSLLERDGGRQLFLNRLGPEAADTLDEFLELAIGYDDNSPPSLTGFLSSLRQGGHEVKRDMEHGRDEVRVMTVHGAKGLEAPIVFLPDTCTTRSGAAPGVRLVKLEDAPRPSNVPAPPVWVVKGTSAIPAIRAARQKEEQREAEERNRLLYVAMTRARDRLYISGYEGKNGREAGCWYALIEEALAPLLRKTEADGRTVARFDTAQDVEPESKGEMGVVAIAAVPLPPFALKRASAEPQLSVPLAPSRLEPYAPDAEGEPVFRPTTTPTDTTDRPSPLKLAEGNRFLRGTLIHALLEHLPSLPQEKRATAAAGFVEKLGAALPARVRASVVKETMAILAHKDFAHIFSETSRAEVAIAATLARPRGKGPPIKLSGQIDRLAVVGNEILIIDYKTNRPPPLKAENVAPAYLFQLAAYVLALREIYPDKRVRAALLWTDGARLMEIPHGTLAEYVDKLWDLDPASLDAP